MKYIKKIFQVFFLLLFFNNCSLPDNNISVITTADTVKIATYYKKALALSDSAMFDSASYYARQASVICLKCNNQVNYINCLHIIGNNFKLIEQVDSAAYYFNLSLYTARRYLGDSTLKVVQALNCSGEVAYIKGDFLIADSLLKLAYRINKKLPVTQQTETALILYNLGKIWYAREKSEKDLDSALTNERKALAISIHRLGEENREIAAMYNIIGNIYFKQGDLDSALFAFKKALAINLKFLGKQHPEVGRNYSNLGMLYDKRSNNISAKLNFNNALVIYKKFFGNKKRLALLYNNTAGVHYNESNYEEAINLYKSATTIMLLAKDKNYKMLATTNENIALCYGHINQFKEAFVFFDNALELLKKDDRLLIARIYLDQSRVYRYKMDYIKAQEYCLKAFTIYKTIASDNSIYIANCYQTQADILKNYGDHKLVLPNYKRALQIFQRKNDQSSIVSCLISIGDTWLEMNLADSAISYYDKVLQVVPDYSQLLVQERNPKGLQYRNQLIRLLAAEGNAWKIKYNQSLLEPDLCRSFKYFDLANLVNSKLRATFKSENAKLFLNEHNEACNHAAIETAYILYKKTSKQEYLNRAFCFAEQNKYSVLAEMIKGTIAKYAAGIPDSLLMAEEKLFSSIIKQERTLLNQQSEQKRRDIDISNSKEKILINQKHQYDELLEYFEKHYPYYYKIISNPDTLCMDELQKKLVAGKALIEYTLTDKFLYIFAITGSNKYFERIPNDSIIKNVEELIAAINRSDFNSYTASAYFLYTKLIAPIKPHLKNIKQLLIIPDNVLGYLPFDALLKDTSDMEFNNYASLSYLIREYQIGYNYSSTFYCNYKPQRLHTDNAFLGFAPSFNLLGSQKEVEKIAGMLGGKYYLRQEATKENFVELAGEADNLLLATHADISAENPDYYKILFSKSAFKRDSVLYAYELHNLKLKARMAVINTCNSGNGKVREGEGIMSIARGIAYAGCPNIVMNLWSVSDKTGNCEIIQGFYSNLKSGMKKDEALHMAKLHYILNSERKKVNPFFWANFVFIGDPTPLYKGKTYYCVLTLLICIVAFVIIVFSKKLLTN